MVDQKIEERLQLGIFLDALEQGELGIGRQIGELLAGESEALMIDLREAAPVGFLQGLVETSELGVDVVGNSGFDGAGILIFGDDAAADGLEGPSFVEGEEAPGAFAAAAGGG